MSLSAADAIRHVTVIGSGVMGAGIAAHMANAGVEVLLLDIVPDGSDDRSTLARAAIANMAKTDPSPIMHKRVLKAIKPGNLEDDLDEIGRSDWIIEVILEDPGVKQRLYRQIDAKRKDGSIVSSNTSTLPLSTLTAGMEIGFRQDFAITHFFNPPRYMRLFELVGGPDTRPTVLDTLEAFADRRLGKGVIHCNDSPGFIANRIGAFWLQTAVALAIEMDIDIETADAVLGRPAGIPKTGVFGLLDLVGLDLMPHIVANLRASLPDTDPFQQLPAHFPVLQEMIDNGYTGRKGKGGFYRLNRSGGRKVKEAVNLRNGEYDAASRPKPPCVKTARKSGLRAMLEEGSGEARYAHQVLTRTLAYAAGLVPEVSEDISAIDAAMRLGYNWKKGPFELADDLGVDWLANQIANQGDLPPLLEKACVTGGFYQRRGSDRLRLAGDGEYHLINRPDGVLLLEDIKRRTTPLYRNRSASVWDIGDGVLCLEFHSKMNSLNPFVMWAIDRAVELAENGYRGLVIYNEGSNFSVGANIALLLYPAKLGMKFLVRWLIRKGQNSLMRMKYSAIPVVGAPSGMALGGGCEVLLHCNSIQAHAESYVGLVEVGVGIVPGWGGCKEMITRWVTSEKRKGGPFPPVQKVFELIGLAHVAKSASEAQAALFFPADSGITMNRDRLLADAKGRVLQMAVGYQPPEPVDIRLPGRSAREALRLAVQGFRRQGLASAHDEVVADHLAQVITGGETDMTTTVSEHELLAFERQAVLSLSGMGKTLQRISHILKTGKPLRN